MIVTATDIRVTCNFLVIDENTGDVLEKLPVTLDIQNLNEEFFKMAHQHLQKTKVDLLNKSSQISK